ncbi:pentatricopeptide repeat-containing protein At3g49240, mitochondrial [Ricinus communis]|uniref:pentatricopeptide repeat-containing protein At3g49240, mitochondrial n=1 Tax=Ricinus communis TaxID=3988 RepID=UPI00201A58DD|nr:pentatricopeptide repeat-containing protein At3g49240, mitochondrial [Ricinus communis]
MALSKLSFLTHLKCIATHCHRHRHHHHHHHLPPPSIISLRFLSYSSAEEAAAERRRRKRRLRIEPPLSSLHRTQQQQQKQQIPKPIQNPNSPKLPEPISELSGKRHDLHNRILTLIRENDLDEAALFTRHSVYSNCRPTIYTVNAVLNAQLRQSKYSDLLSLHRFIIQAGIAPNIITHNLIFQTYLDCRKPDTALEHYKQLINDAPFNPSPTTYRILIKGLVDNGKVDKALELKDEIIGVRGFTPDPLVYHYLMVGCVRNLDSEGVFRLFDELKEKMGGGVIEDGVVYGDLMKGYFMKGMENEAMECYEEAVGENSKVRMNAVAYNSVLDALCKNGKFDVALKLFDRMLQQHNPPRYLAVNLGSFNVIVDGYCAQGRFEDAIDVFRKMGDYRCSPDVLSYNNLIDQLCKNGMLVEAEDLYGEMDGKGVKPDEYTYGLLMDTCLEKDRVDDGAGYFRKMVDTGLRPNLAVYNRLVDKLVKLKKIDEAKSFYYLMVKKLKMDNASYKFMMEALADNDQMDELIKMVDGMLDDEAIELDLELQEFAKELLGRVGRGEELMELMEKKEKEKAEAKAKEAEAAEAAKRSAKAAVASLLPSKLFGNKEAETESKEANGNGSEAASVNEGAPVEEATIVGSVPADMNTKEDVIQGETEAKSDAATGQ